MKHFEQVVCPQGNADLDSGSSSKQTGHALCESDSESFDFLVPWPRRRFLPTASRFDPTRSPLALFGGMAARFRAMLDVDCYRSTIDCFSAERRWKFPRTGQITTEGSFFASHNGVNLSIFSATASWQSAHSYST